MRGGNSSDVITKVLGCFETYEGNIFTFLARWIDFGVVLTLERLGLYSCRVLPVSSNFSGEILLVLGP